MVVAAVRNSRGKAADTLLNCLPGVPEPPSSWAWQCSFQKLCWSYLNRTSTTRIVPRITQSPMVLPCFTCCTIFYRSTSTVKPHIAFTSAPSSDAWPLSLNLNILLHLWINHLIFLFTRYYWRAFQAFASSFFLLITHSHQVQSKHQYQQWGRVRKGLIRYNNPYRRISRPRSCARGNQVSG